MSKRKYSKEFKFKALKEHQEGASFYSLEKKYKTKDELINAIEQYIDYYTNRRV